MTELESLCRNYIEHELRASESLQTALEENTLGDVSEEFKVACAEMVNELDDPKRKQSVLISTFRVGEAIESQDLIMFTKEHLDEWNEKYGE